MLQKENSELVKNLKESLGPQYAKQLAHRTGLARQTVMRVVNNLEYSHEIWPEVEKLAAENVQTVKERQQAIKNILGND